VSSAKEKCSQLTISQCSHLLSSLVAKLKKSSSPRLKPRTFFRGCGLFPCNLLLETNNFGLGPVLSCLVSEVHELPYRDSNSGHFSGVLTLLCYIFPVSRNKHTKFGTNRFIPSRSKANIYTNIESYKQTVSTISTLYIRCPGAWTQLLFLPSTFASCFRVQRLFSRLTIPTEASRDCIQSTVKI
jgi:hypothetical protein